MIKVHKPVIVRKIWGGKKLETWKQLSAGSSAENDSVPIGETLEIFDESLTYLAKFIDTSDELSIQVHPGDDYARAHENSSGKTECWIILEADKGAGIFLGLKKGITKADLEKALLEKKQINEYLNFYEVKSGDFFYVPSGSIHAIGKNITLAEVQQNSGITYRVWDWNRVDEKGQPRELHVKKSLDVISFEAEKNALDFFMHKQNLFQRHGHAQVCSHPDFELSILNQNPNEKYFTGVKLQRPCSVLNLNGRIAVNGINLDSYGAMTIDGDETSLSIEALEEGSCLIIF
jgi:mannose-6-phosphate isomerase